jgi:hypothetical protein
VESPVFHHSGLGSKDDGASTTEDGSTDSVFEFSIASISDNQGTFTEVLSAANK